MLPFFKTNKQMTMVIAGTILALGITSYYLSHHWSWSENKPLLPQETEVVKQDTKIKIASDTNITQKIIYSKCNDEEVLRTKASSNLIGLNYYQLQKMYPGWNINKFDNLEVDMTLKVESYCREHANNLFIGIKDNYVTVFYGKPGPKAIVKEITKIPISKLQPQDVEELGRGMIVTSREEVLRTLEGLQSR